MPLSKKRNRDRMKRARLHAKAEKVLVRLKLDALPSTRRPLKDVGSAILPVSEAWLFNDPTTLALARQGLSDAAHGKVAKVDRDAL